MESTSEGINASTESMYTKAVPFFFVNNGCKVSVKQAMTIAGFSKSDSNMDKHLSTVNCRKRRLIKQGSALPKVHLQLSRYNNLLLQYPLSLRIVQLLQIQSQLHLRKNNLIR